MFILMIDGEMFDVPQGAKKITVIRPLDNDQECGDNANAIVEMDDEGVLMSAANDQMNEQIISQSWQELVDCVDWFQREQTNV